MTSNKKGQRVEEFSFIVPHFLSRDSEYELLPRSRMTRLFFSHLNVEKLETGRKISLRLLANPKSLNHLIQKEVEKRYGTVGKVQFSLKQSFIELTCRRSGNTGSASFGHEGPLKPNAVSRPFHTDFTTSQALIFRRFDVVKPVERLITTDKLLRFEGDADRYVGLDMFDKTMSGHSITDRPGLVSHSWDFGQFSILTDGQFIIDNDVESRGLCIVDGEVVSVKRTMRTTNGITRNLSVVRVASFGTPLKASNSSIEVTPCSSFTRVAGLYSQKEDDHDTALIDIDSVIYPIKRSDSAKVKNDAFNAMFNNIGFDRRENLCPHVALKQENGKRIGQGQIQGKLVFLDKTFKESRTSDGAIAERVTPADIVYQRWVRLFPMRSILTMQDLALLYDAEAGESEQVRTYYPEGLVECRMADDDYHLKRVSARMKSEAADMGTSDYKFEEVVGGAILKGCSECPSYLQNGTNIPINRGVLQPTVSEDIVNKINNEFFSRFGSLHMVQLDLILMVKVML